MASVDLDGHLLIGEQTVRDDASASKLADQCVAEAQCLLTSNTGWRTKMESGGVFVEVSNVVGPYEGSGVHLVRATGQVCCSAEDFNTFQMTKNGFAATDEYLQNHRNLARYNWVSHAPEAVLEVNRVEWKYPFKTREFVALDFMDPDTGIFISKSCLHGDRPGGSKYSSVYDSSDERERVRAVQYYAVKAEPISDISARLTMVTWGEMCDTYDPMWVNEFNARLFVVPKFQRFRQCLARLKAGADEDQIAQFLKQNTQRNIQQVAWDLLKIAPSLVSKVALSLGDGSSSDFTKKRKKI